MTEYDTLEVLQDETGIVELILDQPDKRNALSAVMIAELTDFATTIETDPAVRAVILSGRGKVFCAGGDLNWMRAQIDADRATRIFEATKLANMLRALNEMPVPLIGKIHGGAFGGGVGLASICDTVVAADTAKFGLTETRLGLIPATIGPYVIARLGEGRARHVFMSARIFDAGEARNLGLINEVCASDDLDARARHYGTPYLTTKPGAVAAAKALARKLGPRIDDDTIRMSVESLADIWEGPEARAGIKAFFDK